LGRLDREDLIRSELSGHQKYFELNRSSPVLNEVRSIARKAVGAAPLPAQPLKRIEAIEAACLFGSFA
jgi:hypothetical protein